MNMNKDRLGAFTDAIVAIAATIMVLELKAPAEKTLAGLLDESHVLIAYVISFFMIYIVWFSHHNLFEKAENITPTIFLINGVWIFFLTLVPFATTWVGSAPEAAIPEFLYALLLFLWSATFQWLDYQIRRDNPSAQRDVSTHLLPRIALYGTYVAAIIFAFFIPQVSMYLIGANTIVLVYRMFKEARSFTVV